MILIRRNINITIHVKRYYTHTCVSKMHLICLYLALVVINNPCIFKRRVNDSFATTRIYDCVVINQHEACLSWYECIDHSYERFLFGVEQILGFYLVLNKYLVVCGEPHLLWTHSGCAHFYWYMICWFTESDLSGTFLLTWIKFYPSMNTLLHPLYHWSLKWM